MATFEDKRSEAVSSHRKKLFMDQDEYEQI